MIPTLDSVAWNSRWRARSVAEKATLCVGLSLCAVILPPWPAAVLVLGVVFLAGRLAGFPAHHLPVMLCVPLLFIVTAAASTALTLDPAGPRLTTSVSALVSALDTATRSISATSALILLASTTPMTALTASLRRVGLPPACIDVVTAMYRMVFLLLESLAVVRKSQLSRLGYSSARRSIRSGGLLTAAVLVRAWTRGHAVERGLAGRNVGDGSCRPPAVRVSRRFLGAAVALNVGIAGASTLITVTTG